MTPSEKPNDANAATAVVVVVSIVAGLGCFMYVAWALGGWTGVVALGGVLCLKLAYTAAYAYETDRTDQADALTPLEEET